MENFFIDTEDPLFSIFLFIAILLFAAVANYSYELYKQRMQRRSLFKFLKNFDANKCNLDMQNMEYHDSLLKPLSLLAKSFENSGEYGKAIEIYLFFLKHLDDVGQKIIFMELLGKTYLHAGFLEKSKDIFLQILKQRPRNKVVLNYLLIVYDQLKNYKKAKEVIEPLKILGEDVEHIENYLEFKSGGDVEAILEKDSNLTRLCMNALFQKDWERAWGVYKPEMFDDIVDILWYLSRSHIDFAVVQRDKNLKALYYAKGYSKEEVKSKNFHINLLTSAKKNGLNATLTFSYICKSCKSSFPLSFERCPNCLQINSAKVKIGVTQASEVKKDSFS